MATIDISRRAARPTGNVQQRNVSPAHRWSSVPPCGWSSSCRRALTAVVDRPPLVSSDASPTRRECGITRVWIQGLDTGWGGRRREANAIICADNGTTRSRGSGFVPARSVRRARAGPFFCEPPIVHIAVGICLAPAHGDEKSGRRRSHRRRPPSASRPPRCGASGHETAVERPPHRDAHAQERPCRIRRGAPPRTVSGGEHSRPNAVPARARGPPVRRPLGGGRGLPGQLRAGARRGDRHRAA